MGRVAGLGVPWSQPGVNHCGVCAPGYKSGMNWREFWDRDTPIYVSDRHKILHYRRIAGDIAALVPSPAAQVLDHGCGEALSADRVAARCARLYLCDAAPSVREKLTRRFRSEPKISLLSPEEIEAIPEASLDLIVANSLVQYLSFDELRALLRLWRRKLAPSGALILADVIPHEVSPITDAKALLGFAWSGGFLLRAVVGLARTAVSDYRKLRDELGLAQYDEAEMIALLRDEGFSAERRRPNIGHNPARMTFLARPL
jgi:SAM-dependent methyltransferase